MKVKILTGGPLDCVPQTVLNEQNAQWCGIDYGAVELIRHGISPFLAVGDFDTANEEERKIIQQKSGKFIYHPLKDDLTDTELGLQYLIKHYQIDQIEIYGATGARMDQLLANIFFVLKPCYRDYVAKIKIIDRWNEIEFFVPGKHCLKRNPVMKYLAFVPLIEVDGLELPDEKYQLKRTDFKFPVALSSNEYITNEAHFSFETGIVMTIQSCD